MTTPWIRITVAALALAWLSAAAQTGPVSPGSAPQVPQPGPRTQTPTQLREGATAPGDLRPDERVTPQVVVPLRKEKPPNKAERAAARRGAPASSPAIGDAAARCEAEVSKSARAKCLAGLPRP